MLFDFVASFRPRPDPEDTTQTVVSKKLYQLRERHQVTSNRYDDSFNLSLLIAGTRYPAFELASNW